MPMVSVHPDRINLYSEVHWSPYRPVKPKHEHLLSSDKKTHGKVSDQARRKVSKAVEYLLFMANDKYLPDTAHGKAYKFKIAFITLTLPSNQVHDDNEIKSICLNQFLIELRKKWQVRNYIWRAEKQKNGNLHFHILVDRFVPWSELRDSWNRITNKLGYVDRYRNQMRAFHSEGFAVRKDLLKNWDYKQQIKAYKKGKANDWNSPNSTDIHSLYRIQNVKKYIVKYCTKSEENAEVNGRIWSCNEELSEIRGGKAVAVLPIKEEISKLASIFPDKVYCSDYFSVVMVDVQTLYDLRCMNLYQLFADYMNQAFNFSIQTRAPG
jgi:hypothetical protein